MQILIRYSVIILVPLFFHSCKCSDITCPGFDAKYNDWLPYSNGEIIKYVNDSNNEIDFTVSHVDITVEKTYHCGADGYGGCHCPDCQTPSAEMYAQTNDTSRKIVNALGQTVSYFKYLNVAVVNNSAVNDSIKISYGIFDFNYKANLEPSFTINPGDSILTTVTFGNITYNNVIVHERDTTIIQSANPIYNVYFVWKAYFNKQYGIIAFEDLKTNSFFYLKP